MQTSSEPGFIQPQIAESREAGKAGRAGFLTTDYTDGTDGLDRVQAFNREGTRETISEPFAKSAVKTLPGPPCLSCSVGTSLTGLDSRSFAVQALGPRSE